MNKTQVYQIHPVPQSVLPSIDNYQQLAEQHPEELALLEQKFAQEGVEATLDTLYLGLSSLVSVAIAAVVPSTVFRVTQHQFK